MGKAKTGLLVAYALFLAAVMLGSETVSWWAAVALVGTLVIHALEFAVMRGVMVKAGGSMSSHFVQTLIYGFMHWGPLQKKRRE